MYSWWDESYCVNSMVRLTALLKLFYMSLCISYKIKMLQKLADFNLAVSTLTAKPPNLISHQIIQLHGMLASGLSLLWE